MQLLSKSQATPELASLLERSAYPALPASLCSPLVGFKTPAGFPSPAADFQVERLDLGEKLELERPYVFMGRVSGSSMTGRGIDNVDLIVINRKITPRHDQVVVAVSSPARRFTSCTASSSCSRPIRSTPTSFRAMPRSSRSGAW